MVKPDYIIKSNNTSVLIAESSKASSAEVFRCSLETCGHFYHPQCVSKLLEDGSDSEAHGLEEKIIAGEPFTCPAHKCHKCKQEENEKVKGLQFAICRRCPRSYHKKCLPSKIVFDCEDNDENVIARAWNGLLPKSRALIFCLKHKMDKKLHISRRNIKFPEIEHNKKEIAFNEEGVNSAYTFDERRAKKLSSGKRARMSSRSEPVKKRKKENLAVNIERDSKEYSLPFDEDEQTPTATPMESEDEKTSLHADSKEHSIPFDEDEQTPTATPMESEDGKTSLDAASRERILEMEEVESYITVDKLKRHDIAPFLDEIPHMEVENRELNCEVSLKSSEKESACLRSQKESSQCDNGETQTKGKVDGHKVNHISYLPHQSPPSKIRPSDYEIRRSNYVGHGYNRDCRRESFSRQRVGYVSRHHDSHFWRTYTLADPSTYNMSSISVMQRYAPKLE